MSNRKAAPRSRYYRDTHDSPASIRSRIPDDPAVEIRLKQTQPDDRRCLCGCGRMFKSKWPGDRFIRGHKRVKSDHPYAWDGPAFTREEVENERRR